MNQKWEINRVSTSERIFDKINNEMAQPVGIVLFGADCELKDDVLMNCQREISNLVGYGDVVSASIICRLGSGQSVMVAMNGDLSSDREQRHRVVTALRDFGAKSVVGIYTKVDDPRDDKYYRTLETRAKRREVEQCIEMLRQSPPTADGLDYLLVVSKEKEV